MDLAERRMFAKTIVTSDAFLDMPPTARCLYFFLAMMADDDGFMNAPNSAIRQSGATVDDMKLLIAKRFVLTFESGVVVIKHWRIHNYLQKDRYKETVYLKEKSLLELDENNAYTEVVSNMDTECIQGGYKVYTQDRLGKESKVKDSEGEGSRVVVEVLPPTPTLSEIRDYIAEHGLNVNAEKFFRYYDKNGWKTIKGKEVKWQDKLHEWSESEGGSSSGTAGGTAKSSNIFADIAKDL